MQKLRLFGMNGVFALMLACTAGIAHGQQAGYLILVDAENKQPFIARIGETLMQSSSHGHLLIPQLQDSSYRVIIRFPRKSIPEQVFPINTRKKDQGFLLQGADSSWVLYNWQSKETIYPLKELDSSRFLDQGVKREDGFSRLMASVVNDSSVMYNTYGGGGLSKDTLAGRVVLRDSASVVTTGKKKPGKALPDNAGTAKKGRNPEADMLKIKIPVVKVKTAKPDIKKLREVTLKISRKIIFLDVSPEGERDTVTLFLYFEQPEAGVKKHPREDPMVTARRLLRNDTASGKPAGQGKGKQVSAGKELVKSPAKDTVLIKDKIALGAGKVSPVSVNTCVQEATEPDVEALRSAILIRNSEQEKISVASGAFAMKCFSVSQVRLLADLFVYDRAKYRFLNAAHKHVSDPDHFHELADMLVDKAYLKKFMELVEKRG